MAADGARLPLGVATGRQCLVYVRLIGGVEAADERRNAERADTAGLSVLELHRRNVARDALDSDRVFVCQLVILALDLRFADEDAGVGVEPGEGAHDVVVERYDFAERARVLELCDGGFFDRDDDRVLGLRGNDGGAAADSGVGMLNLKETAVGTEPSD